MRIASTAPPAAAAVPSGTSKPASGGAALALAAVLVLSATTITLTRLDTRPGREYQLHTILLASDLALLVLLVAAAGGLRAVVAAWRDHACALAGLALGLALVPAALLHPSDRGAAALLRLGGAVAVGVGLASARGEGRRLVGGALAVVSLAHVAVAFAQRAAGGPIGLRALGEARATQIGGRYASSGLAVHPYVLAAWCAVAGTGLLLLARRPGWPGRLATVGGVAAFAGIGLTLSRTGAVAGTLAVAALAVSTRRRADRRWRAPVAAAAAALPLGALVSLSGWLARAGQGSESVETLSSGRGALLRQAWGLLGDHLVTGVGPGRYVLSLIERPDLVQLSSQSPRPVHLTPLLLVVEGGLLVVPALLLLAVAVGRACRRGGAAAVAVTLAMAPFLALDHLAWSYPQGLVLTGLWLGLLDLLSRAPDGDRAGDAGRGPDPAPAATGPPAAPA